MKGLRTVVLATVLVLGGLVVAAAEGPVKPVGPVTQAELKASLSGLQRDLSDGLGGVKREVEKSRRTTLMVMLGLACLTIFVYAKVGMVEKKLLKK